MKVLVVLAFAAVAVARSVEEAPAVTAFGYYEKIGIPLAEEIAKAEAEITNSRIINGNPANLGQFPYQAGLLASFDDIQGVGVCGGSLVSANKVITAAHCWNDGINQARSFEVVLGSVLLFSGGTRVQTSNVIMHPGYLASVALNDVAMISLPSNVAFSNTISAIALPSGSELNDNFAGAQAVASGFGLTSQTGSIQLNQSLNHVRLNVIAQNTCFLAFPLHLQPNNICTSGLGTVGTCRGDSGGPLVVDKNGRNILIGITSFGSGLGCESGMPAVYARTTSFMDFFNQHL